MTKLKDLIPSATAGRVIEGVLVAAVVVLCGWGLYERGCLLVHRPYGYGFRGTCPPFCVAAVTGNDSCLVVIENEATGKREPFLGFRLMPVSMFAHQVAHEMKINDNDSPVTLCDDTKRIPPQLSLAESGICMAQDSIPSDWQDAGSLHAYSVCGQTDHVPRPH